ncbi:MAG: signal peptidase II, partial [Bacillota bacterium]|nr:signal peptidase II [Bacillota bacterium]
MAKRTLLLAAMFAIADQIVKQLVISFVKPVYTVTVINGLFDLDYVQNRGAAFGILEQHRWIFISGTIIAIILFVIFLFKTNIKSKLFMLSASLIVGGGIGNLIDRIYL